MRSISVHCLILIRIKRKFYINYNLRLYRSRRGRKDLKNARFLSEIYQRERERERERERDDNFKASCNIGEYHRNERRVEGVHAKVERKRALYLRNVQKHICREVSATVIERRSLNTNYTNLVTH